MSLLTLADNASLVDASYTAFLVEDEAARQRAILKARSYHKGEQSAHLTDRMREFLGLNPHEDTHFNLNICKVIVDAVEERMLVQGFDSKDEVLKTWGWEVWVHNRMDAQQSDVHSGMLRDSEYFVVVDWDMEASKPRFTPHPAYTDPELDGDGFGCKIFYPDKNPYQPARYATKQWIQDYSDPVTGATSARKRLTMYYPDRIEKYVWEKGDWTAMVDAEDMEQWPLPWVGRDGRPLGVAVMRVKNVDDEPEAWSAFPAQDGINKTFVDLLATGDLTAFRIFVALGFIPTTDGQLPREDGGNALKIQPGSIVGTTKPDASFNAIEPANPDALINTIQSLFLWTAIVTSTPVSRFLTSKQVAAEGTQKEQQGPLLAKVRKRQTLAGNLWEDCMKLGRRLANTFGSAGLNEDATLSTRWEPAEARDEKAELEMLAIKLRLGIPQEQLWAEMGYDQEQIKQWKVEAERKAQQEMQQALLLKAAAPTMGSSSSGGGGTFQ